MVFDGQSVPAASMLDKFSRQLINLLLNPQESHTPYY